MQRDLFNPEPDLSRGHQVPTSQVAHAKLEPRKPTLGRQVLDVVIQAGAKGATLEECCDALDRPPHSLSGRLTELQKDGSIRDSGRTRKNRRGNDGAVYVVG